ncbi:hypothetical protein DV735_g1098, partial [Chaetothyriales sp. CBS 134920]
MKQPDADALHEYEDQVFAAHGNLTYDPKEARVFLARISQKKRAAFELRAKGIWTEEDTASGKDGHAGKRRKLNEEQEDEATSASPSTKTKDAWPNLISHVLVVKMDWLDACLEHNRVVPYQPQLVYYAKLVPRARHIASTAAGKETTISSIKAGPTTASVSRPHAVRSQAQRRLLASSGQPQGSSLKWAPLANANADACNSNGNSSDASRSTSPSKDRLPPLPAWASGPHASYSCCRSTRVEGPNTAFIAQLLKIKEHRVLTLDSVGVRAYSSAIASLSAYTHPIRHSAEMIRLPSCNERISTLWQEWHDSAAAESDRSIADVKRLEADADLGILRMLYNIWGVGPDIARRFYLVLGWKDLDDIVESGWNTLSRVQQIGVKYYDEFLVPIGRAETANGDVDVIITHRDPAVTTTDLLIGVVSSLEEAALITHTLRDIRRFAKVERGWKFDGAGVRADHGRGPLLDFLEQPRPRPRLASQVPGSQREEEEEVEEWEWKDDWASRERRLMDALGIGWRPPEERCTG